MLGLPCLHCTAMVQPPDRSSVRVRPGRGPRTGGGQPDTTSCDTPTGRGTRAVLYRQVPAAGSIPHVPAQQLRPTGSQHQLPPRARGSAPTMHGLQFARPELAHSHSGQSDQDPTFCGGGGRAARGRARGARRTPRRIRAMSSYALARTLVPVDEKMVRAPAERQGRSARTTGHQWGRPDLWAASGGAVRRNQNMKRAR